MPIYRNCCPYFVIQSPLTPALGRFSLFLGRFYSKVSMSVLLTVKLKTMNYYKYKEHLCSYQLPRRLPFSKVVVNVSLSTFKKKSLELQPKIIAYVSHKIVRQICMGKFSERQNLMDHPFNGW